MEMFKLIASDIKKLDLKLDGKLPIDRDELLALVNSWGRNNWCFTFDKDGNQIQIEKCIENKKYDLSKLDVSEITNFNEVFVESNFNGNINSWDVSNATSIDWMFAYTNNFNSPLNSWDTSKVTSLAGIFYEAKKFNQPILWDLSKIKSYIGMFYNAKAFETRFNSGKELPYYTNEVEYWLIENRNIMEKIEIEDKIDNNRNSLDKLLEAKQIDPKSKLGLELIEIYNETQNKLKLDLDNLKNEVKTLAINDFSSFKD